MEIKIPVELPDDWYDKVAEKLIKNGDFVIVTRCKNCKWFYPESPENRPACRKPRIMFLPVEPDDFCSYAEQKEIEGE